MSLIGAESSNLNSAWRVHSEQKFGKEEQILSPLSPKILAYPTIVQYKCFSISAAASQMDSNAVTILYTGMKYPASEANVLCFSISSSSRIFLQSDYSR